MKPRPWTYLLLAAVFLASFLSAWLISGSEGLKFYLATPGVIAMLGILFQVARDQSAFENAQHLQRDQQIFTLGANSHMAEVAFDKHAAFCERYMAEVHETIGYLFREGPSTNATNRAFELVKIRREFAAWIPRDVSLELEPFENAILKIGTDTHLVNSLQGSDPAARTAAIDRSYAMLMNVIGLKRGEGDPPHDPKIAGENVKDRVRNILGIDHLTKVRDFIIRKSADFIQKHE